MLWASHGTECAWKDGAALEESLGWDVQWFQGAYDPRAPVSDLQESLQYFPF